MSVSLRERAADVLRLLLLSARAIGGRRFWIALVLPLLWPAFQVFRVVVGWRATGFRVEDAQSLIAFPLTVLGVLLGGRIIAGEIDRRTLEIAYTVPGGAKRVWLSKLAAALAILAAVDLILGLATLVFLTEISIGSLWGAFQGAAFYLVLAMALAAFFKSEATGALVTTGILVFNGFIASAANVQLRWSPFFNPAAISDAQPSEILAWTVQNRILFILLVAALVALAIGRAERREKMLAG